MIWDRDAERAALGAMMLDHKRAWDVLDIAPPADFHDPGHEQIADAVRRLLIRGAGTDGVLVEDELRAMGATIHQGSAYVYELTSVATSAAMGEHYAEIVAELAIRRRLAEASAAVAKLASDRSLPAVEQVEAARAAMDGIVAGQSDVHVVGAAIDDTIASLTEVPEMVPTPWRDVNAVIGGLRPGDVYVIGARPATGKTAAGLNLAVAVAQTGKTAVFVSLEMGERELHKRLIAQLGQVHLTPLNNNAVAEHEWPRVVAARDELMKLPLVLIDNAAATVAQIRGYVRTLSRTREIGSLTVDYVGLLQGADDVKNRQETISAFSRGMKLIAKEFHIPVVLLSQLNRKSEERIDRRPHIADLRESGSLEQDASVAFLLYRDENDESKKGEVGMLIAKNRHGPTGEVSLAWQGHYQIMSDLGFDDGWEPGA